MTRSPKGGIEIMGVFYKGGQFLPSNEPQRGAFSGGKKTREYNAIANAMENQANKCKEAGDMIGFSMSMRMAKANRRKAEWAANKGI